MIILNNKVMCNYKINSYYYSVIVGKSIILISGIKVLINNANKVDKESFVIVCAYIVKKIKTD